MNQKLDHIINQIKIRDPSKEITILGKGKEGCIITDGEKTYKIFSENTKYDYFSFYEQLCGRFKESKHFININNVFKVKNHTVISYKYKPSEPYDFSNKEEITEFLIEAWRNRIVCWDIKPSNFRRFDDDLKLVDFGKDIRPFNWKDFLFMAQRAYLMIDFGKLNKFREKAKIARENWHFEKLMDFIQFFNNLYKRILETQEVKSSKYRKQPIITFGKKNLLEKAIEKILSLNVTYSEIIFYSNSDNLSEHGIKTINNFVIEENKRGYNAIILDLTDKSFYEIDEKITRAKDFLQINGHLLTLIKNPFFCQQEHKKPLEKLKQKYLKSGYVIDKIFDSDWEVDEDDYFFSEYLIIQSSIHKNYGDDVSLIIKTCYQDAQMVDRLVKHIVKQCEGPDLFLEKIVVLDSKHGNFLRQFSKPDKALTHKVLENLVKENIIDRFIVPPNDEKQIRGCYKRWFDVYCSETHNIKDVPVYVQLLGFERARGKYILQVDSDAIIVRRDSNHSFLKDMKLALQTRKDALSVSFNIAHNEQSQFKEYSSPKSGMFVPEVRFCLFEKERFFSHRPYPNEVRKNRLVLTWYRSVEQAQLEKNLVSLRGGDPKSFYIHPPNSRKTDLDEWIYIINRAEQAFVPEVQLENIELTGNIIDWRGPKRNESIIFVICGRNVPPRKFLRCWKSLINQNLRNWGAILVDDGSENSLYELMTFLSKEFNDKVTVVSNHKRLGVLHNVVTAVKEYCDNPFSVIVILDGDDMLLSNDITSNLRRYYTQGYDMTVGTFFRLDKGIIPYKPDFSNPRNKCGGDVWMHLRSFRKYLFDNVDEDDMKFESEWIDKFTELTYMVPISEMSSNPLHIRWPIYFYEPTQKRDKEHYRKNKITLDYIQNRREYSKIEVPDFPLKPQSIICNTLSKNESNIIFIRHSEKEPDQKEPSLTEEGIELCHIFGNNLPFKLDLILSTNTKRTVKTAKFIRDANKVENCEIGILRDYSKAYNTSKEERDHYKEKFGWLPYLEKWVKGEFRDTNIVQSRDIVIILLQEVLSKIEECNANQTLVVAHDNTITFLVDFISHKIITKVDYLSGVVLSKKELKQLLKGE